MTGAKKVYFELKRLFLPAVLLTLLVSISAFAQDSTPPAAPAAAAPINGGDTAFILICTALVMLMTPGVAFFYSGMVHAKNAVATMMQSFMKLCIITLFWTLWGYSLAFGTSFEGLIGGLDFLGFKNVGVDPAGTSTIPHILFATFQCMFAVVTAAIITGSFAERMRLGPTLAFSALWITFVYAPVAHWVWGGGWIMKEIGALDFAGGAVVHVNSAVAGLVAALCLGRRVNYTDGEIRPHNMPLTILGGVLLWFGWFGFNAGSALGANGLAALAFANTNIAAAAGAAAWYVAERYFKSKSSALGVISGSIAGLVAITPAAGYVEVPSSIVIGAGGGLFCYMAVCLRPRLGIDDSLDVFGIHGVGAIWGSIATGLFATKAVNPAGADGLLYGNPSLLYAQVVSTAAVIAFSAIMTYVIIRSIRLFVRMRVSLEQEYEGLDYSLHGQKSYDFN